jgi:hypothetical protein
MPGLPAPKCRCGAPLTLRVGTGTPGIVDRYDAACSRCEARYVVTVTLREVPV